MHRAAIYNTGQIFLPCTLLTAFSAWYTHSASTKSYNDDHQCVSVSGLLVVLPY